MEHGIILYKYMPWEAFIKTIESWSLKGTYPTATNDPLEFIAQNTKDIDFVEETRNAALTLPYFHSFSSKITDVAMWGRYGDSSRGVCLAFCFPTDKEVDTSEEDHEQRRYKNYDCGELLKVRYENDRVVLDLKAPFSYEKYVEVLSVKASCWKSECEFRFHDILDNADVLWDGNASYKKYMKHLCGVIVGERCRYSVDYVRKLFSQIRSGNKVSNEKIFENTVTLSNNNSESRMLTFEIKFERAMVDMTKFEITNNQFKDKMKLSDFIPAVGAVETT